MISTIVRTLSRVPIPLRSLAVCVACEECFELGDPTCPSCGSDEYVPLLHQLEGRILNMTVTRRLISSSHAKQGHLRV